MGSHILDILRQGIWASLTGGWFYDPQQQVFCNTFHLYLWVFLLAFPLIVYSTLEASILVWSLYSVAIGVLFGIIKVINYRLHHLFDTGEAEEELPAEDGDRSASVEKEEEGKSGGDSKENEYIEMASLGNLLAGGDHGRPLSTVSSQLEMGKDYSNEPLPSPVVASLAQGGNTSLQSKAPLAKLDGDDITMGGSSRISNKLDNSSSGNDDEDSADQDENIPHTITTQADIEPMPICSSASAEVQSIEPSKAQNSNDLGQGYILGTLEMAKLVAAMDEQGSPHATLKRNESLESSKPPDSLPQSNSGTSLGVENHLKQSKWKASTQHPSCSGEAKRSGTPKLRMRKERKAVRRSKSTAEWCPPAKSATKVKLSSQSLNMHEHSNRRVPVQQMSTSSNSDWSDVSIGEVELPDLSSTYEGHNELILSLSHHRKLNLSTGESSGSTLVAQGHHDRPDSPHPNSIHSVPYRSRSRTSSSSSPLHQDCVPYIYNIWPHKNEDADSDSLTSGGADMCSHSTESSSSANIEPHLTSIKPAKDLDLTTPSSPSAEDLAFMRSQGAIPKKIRSKSARQTNPLKESTSPGSTDLSDPEEIRRRLIEILWDPQQHSEELKQLQQFVKMQRSQSESNTTKEKLDDSLARSSKEDEGRSALKLESQEEERKPALTPTEFSALLPASSQLNRPTNRQARRRRRRHSSQQKKHSESPPMAALNQMVGEDGHLATSHDDTTDGAVHWFQDEQGNWMSYSFGENSSGVALNIADLNMNTNASSSVERRRHPHEADKWSLSSIASNSTVIVEESPQIESPSIHLRPDMRSMTSFQINNDAHTLQTLQSILRRNHASNSSTDSDTTHTKTRSSRSAPKPKHYYKFWLWPTKQFLKIHFDRLALLAALDRNISVIENVISILMAVGVGALGAMMISSDFYHDFFLLLFCFIMASCQYSLLKSVQPDAASPMHGYNRLIVFSRPFYFCVCCSIVLLLQYGIHIVHNKPIYLYGIPFTISSALTFLQNFFKIFILFFPVLFTLGLLPQVSTFLMYMLEQIDMHIFGGNATTSLFTSFYCVCRSCMALLILYGFSYASLKGIGGSEYQCDSNIEEAAQNVPFSILCGLIVSTAYHLSRSASDPGVLWMLLNGVLTHKKDEIKIQKETEVSGETTELVDPLPAKLKTCLIQRLQSDVLVCIAVTILTFAVHVSTAFTSPALQPDLSDALYLLAASVGFLVHYIIPQTRKEMPWLCCSHPLLRSKEWMYYEVKEPPKVIWIEQLYLGLRFFERNIIYTVVCLCATTTSAPIIICKFGNYAGPVIILICSLKMLRFAFSDTPRQYLIIAFTYFFFKYDFRWSSETFLIDYFFISIFFCKFCDFMLKLSFIITYIAPWQITWGSAFHAFAQPFSVPHSAMLFLQATVSALFSTPLNPFLGSAIFFTSYVRPVKFWERDYNTKRVDHTNTRLASQLERNPGADDNNLNSIFYEHLTRSLQHSLCGDLLLGRWGNYTQGDCFIMASDYLNALVHIIEVGNGLVTFQLRGLEFRGTYCQQREVEAITEGVDDNERFCCFEPGHLPHFLSLNAAFNQRWLAWEVVVSKYILEGYSISDNSAATMLQVFELRKALITYYIKSIIYYTVRSPRLEEWVDNQSIRQALHAMEDDNYVDLDPTFNLHVDEDYDFRQQGISRTSFCHIYLTWIQHCANRRHKEIDNTKPSMLVTLCYALSLLGRRALSAASHNSTSVDFFLFGLHALFKGDFRIQSQRDEWVFADMDMMRRVVAPAVRMSLKLHQDHFTSPDEYDDSQVLYDAITEHESNMVISHEADPAWRNAVLSNVPSLLALRHVFDEGSDEYKIIMLNKRYLSFRVVKVNRECVRGLWAGQQQELIFLRNRNPERGSIQNAKQALRNMINSSCDQPIGYPIYVSPLTTSYSTTHDQLANVPVIGGEFKFSAVRCFFTSLWNRMRQRCDATCAGGSASFELDLPYTVSHQMAAATIGSTPRLTMNTQQIDIPLQTLGNRGSLISTASSASKVNTLASLANLTSLINDTSLKDNLPHRVRIVDPTLVYDTINLGRRGDVLWPNEDWRVAGGKSGWKDWTPKKGMEGTIVHQWTPGNTEPTRRSNLEKTIILVQFKDHFVPIAENGVLDLGAEV
ncbi:pecanex-like protein 1 isoform X3 [Biomphalaria glabrata]|uniref:Pecanex-like protein n=1 Tax=Biomphalaria glabrata TaxID=6526 RepID=A0A9W2ZYU4_BIOGL|nr:pecanex-like protein 1 isoform X3 [Biomphalaria glabrata]